MLTLTSEYAMRALIFLTRHADEGPIPGRCIAEQGDIPPKYLSKILGDLVRLGVLSSSPGKHGGFRLLRDPKKIMLYDVLKRFEQFELRRCPFGNSLCSDERPCLAHDKWKKVVETEQRFLRKTSLHRVAIADGKRRRGAKAN